jgi:GNAT superfamily N-acetyltransferase
MDEVLFSGPAFRALEIGEEDVAGLQRFFEANPEYFIRVGGDGPGAGEARKEFEERPPPDWAWDRRWLIRFVDGNDAMVGMAEVVKNLFAEGVWHIGLFIVATSLHGDGTARALYAGLEAWMLRNGARWLRLGVVEGNGPAERFWERVGYLEVRKREGVRIGKLINTLRVMVKPLADGGLPEYLGMVARDRPEVTAGRQAAR